MAWPKFIYLKPKNTMKKLLFLFYLISQAATAQSVELKPTNEDFYSPNINIKNTLNQPGLVHSLIGASGPSVGTVIKADGAYLQTFTNHSLNFAVNDGLALYTVTTASNVIIRNGLELVNEVGYRQIKLSGFTDAFDQVNQASNDGTPNETRIAHGLDASKIISIKLIVNVATGFSVGAEHTYYTNYRTAVSHDPTYIHVWNYPNNSSSIRNKPFKILITYRN
jgi:hypothetical protein